MDIYSKVKNYHHTVLARQKMTVKHILLDCTVYKVNRQWFCSEVCLTDLLKNVSPECILEFFSVDLKCLL